MPYSRIVLLTFQNQRIQRFKMTSLAGQESQLSRLL